MYIFRPSHYNVTDSATARVYEPGGAGNGLLNNLIAYWPGNEANGNTLDLHINALHLTDTNTVTSNPGLVYPLARQYTAANLEYHARPGDDVLLSAGNVDFTLATWVNMQALVALGGIAGKWGSGGAAFGYTIGYYNTTQRFFFAVSSNGLDSTLLSADSLGAPVINTWYFVLCWSDTVADTINIRVNNGVVDSVGYALGVYDNAKPFEIGRYQALFYNSGRIGPTMFWKSAAGGGGVLDAAKRTALWAGGAGLTYAQFTA